MGETLAGFNAFSVCAHPGLERSDNLGYRQQIKHPTLKGFATGETLAGFNAFLGMRAPRVLAALEPWA